MDLLGLLSAVAAVVAFPGGAYLVLATGAAWLGGGPRTAGTGEVAPAPGPAAAAGLVALGMGAALLPLPGSPATELPTRGAPGNLLALLILLGAAMVLLGSTRFDLPRVVAGAAAAVPLPILCAASATFAPAVVLNLSGGRADLARLAAGAAILGAAPLLAGASTGAARAALLAVSGVLALAVAEPQRLAGTPGVVTALVALAAAGAAGLLDRAVAGFPARAPLAVATGVVAAAAATLGASLL